MLKDMLDGLKGKVSSIDELRKIADSKGITYSEKELETAFSYINGQEVDLDALENVSGGSKCKNGGSYNAYAWSGGNRGC